VRSFWGVVLTGLVTFSGVDGHHVSIAPEQVVAVLRSPPGYHSGTMIETQGGNHIVKESRCEVVRRLGGEIAVPGVPPSCKSRN